MKRTMPFKWGIRILSFALLFAICMQTTYADTTTAGSEEKVVYLTFDDGPVPKITERLLDILKEEQVEATFFVVGKEIIGREAILQRIYQEGHGIGLHSYSHNFKHIYQNADNFVEEMQLTLDKVNEVLNKNLDIQVIRFPGGSAGRLNTKLFARLEKEGYKIFDWNIDLKDGINPHLSADQVLRNAITQKENATRRIILGHCNSVNHSTCDALADIIHYYKEQGYTFKKMDNSTEPYYFHFKK